MPKASLYGRDGKPDLDKIKRILDFYGFPAVGRIKHVAEATGYSSASVSRFLSGKQEIPAEFVVRLQLFDNIARYLGVTVNHLCSGEDGPLERIVEGIKGLGVTPEVFNQIMHENSRTENKRQVDYWGILLTGMVALNDETIKDICKLFKVDPFWVTTGADPTILGRVGFVGKVTAEVSPPWLGAKPGKATKLNGTPPPADLKDLEAFHINKMMDQARKESWVPDEIQKAARAINFFIRNAPALASSEGLSVNREGALSFTPSTDDEAIASLDAFHPNGENDS